VTLYQFFWIVIVCLFFWVLMLCQLLLVVRFAILLGCQSAHSSGSLLCVCSELLHSVRFFVRLSVLLGCVAVSTILHCFALSVLLGCYAASILPVYYAI
jgi:hypothetical protein